MKKELFDLFKEICPDFEEYPFLKTDLYKGKIIGNYLGTICNLGTPVVKNASQTLKVTYTLTDGE